MEPQDTQSRLIQAATALFARKGYDGTSVKELAQQAGVNVSLVSYHFGGKEGLYRACLEAFGKARLAAAQRVLQPPTSPEELRIRLGIFLEELLLTHVESPEITQIIHRELEVHFKQTEDIFRRTFFAFYEVLLEFIATAKKNGLLDPSLDPKAMAGLVFGGIIHAARMDHFNSKYFGQSIANPAYRKTLVEHAVRCFASGFAAPAHPTLPKRGEP